MPVSVALLRGINVGGRRSVPMAALRDVFVAAGYGDVTTYIQSGNVVFSHAPTPSGSLRARLEGLIGDAMGFEVPVILRTSTEMAAVVEANPFPEVEATKRHVLFLAEDLPADALEQIEVERFAPETVARRGRDLYLYLPDGMGRARLPQALGRLPTPATARNWRTVQKLVELSSS